MDTIPGLQALEQWANAHEDEQAPAVEFILRTAKEGNDAVLTLLDAPFNAEGKTIRAATYVEDQKALKLALTQYIDTRSADAKKRIADLLNN